MNRAILFVLCLIGIVLSECKTASVSTATTNTPSENVPTIESKHADHDSLAIAIASGEAVYQTKCYQCHNLPRLSDYSRSEWSDIMVSMSRKAHLSEAETNQILAYVTTATKN